MLYRKALLAQVVEHFLGKEEVGSSSLLVGSIQLNTITNMKGFNMKIGIVGLPNVGKSTLFNSITKAGAECANYPFCTIEPNIGVVAVPDERIEKNLSGFEKQVLDRYIQGESYVDIASKLNSPVKSIDNAIQRIRKKAMKCLGSDEKE